MPQLTKADCPTCQNARVVTGSCTTCAGTGFAPCSYRTETKCGLIFRYHKWFFYCVNGRLIKHDNCITVSVLNGVKDASGEDHGICPGCNGQGIEVCAECQGNRKLQRACPSCISS